MSRVAAFSDVYGNRPALEAVLDAIAGEQPDLIVNLGDLASGAVDPRGTLDLLRARPEILTVRGNHERQLLELRPEEMGGVDRIAHAQLTDGDRAWLAQLPERLRPEQGLLAVHGAPGDDEPAGALPSRSIGQCPAVSASMPGNPPWSCACRRSMRRSPTFAGAFTCR